MVRPASVGDGILRLDDSRLATFGRRYRRGLRRMPRGGSCLLRVRRRGCSGLFGYLLRGENRVTAEVLGALERFAFYDRLRRLLPPELRRRMSSAVS